MINAGICAITHGYPQNNYIYCEGIKDFAQDAFVNAVSSGAGSAAMKVTGNANFSRAVSLASGVASGSKSGKVLNSLDNIGASTVKSLNHLDDVKGVSKVSGNTGRTIDYSKQFDKELLNFNDGCKIKSTVDDDMILVQFSSDSPNASLKYWTTVDEANGISTIEEYMDKLALSKDWGNRNTVKVARIRSGTDVKHAIGTARAQTKIADPRPGGGKQILFNEFNTDWITEVRSFDN